MSGAGGRGGARRRRARPGRVARAGRRWLGPVGGGAPLWGAALAAASMGCGGPSRAAGGAEVAPAARLVRTNDEWREARQRWHELGAQLAPARTQSVPVSTTFRAPVLAAPLRARGAYAVRPPDGLRLQLVGPAGTLALDVWAGPGGWRMAVPAIGRVERGALGDERPGRPVGFLRWWLLHPLEGRLLFAGRYEGGDWLFGARAPEGARLWVRASPDGRSVAIERRRGTRVERVRAEGLPCGLARYEEAQTGVGVDVRCDGPATAPNPRAFDDPDAKGAP